METAKKLSVIVPVYNTALYLPRCLDSILSQNYPNSEIICVDDGSTDDSAAILADYAEKHPNIRLIRQPNQGQAAARNAGIKAAGGGYITFVDSDDYLDSAAYAAAMEKFAAAEDIDAVCFAAEIVVEEGGKKFKDDDRYYTTHHEGETALTADILLDENVSVCNKIFKAAIIKEKQISFPDGLWYEDAEFYWKYMVHAKRAWLLPDKFYKYARRRHSTIYSTFRGSDRAVDHLAVLDNVFAYFAENGKAAFFLALGDRLFERYFWFSYKHSSAAGRKSVLSRGRAIAAQYGLADKFPWNRLIKDIVRGHLHRYSAIDEYNFWQKIFSVKKMLYTRYVRFAGLKFEMKRHCYKRMRDFLEG